MGGNYIILIGETEFFAGWGILGEMKKVANEKLAYRFQRPLAEKNLPKLVDVYGDICKIIPLKEGIVI